MIAVMVKLPWLDNIKMSSHSEEEIAKTVQDDTDASLNSAETYIWFLAEVSTDNI